MRKTLLLLLLAVSLATPLLAWGEKGHLISNEAATYGLPADMPVFFHKAYPQLVYLGPNPDRWRGGGPSLEAFNPPNHFLDYEYVANLQLPPQRYRFIDLLYTSGTLKKYGIYNSTTGFLPWTIAELAETLTVEFRLWRQSTPGSVERAQIEQDIIFIAGNLGHFVADAANPHHTTLNYNGWVQDNPEGFANDCDTHDRFEGQFISHAIEARDVFPALAAPVLRTDYFASALGEIAESNANILTLYRIDKKGGFVTPYEGTPEARAFAISRLAAGASMLRDFWWSAWVNSAVAPKAR